MLLIFCWALFVIFALCCACEMRADPYDRAPDFEVLVIATMIFLLFSIWLTL